jgi:hypothetical protein
MAVNITTTNTVLVVLNILIAITIGLATKEWNIPMAIIGTVLVTAFISTIMGNSDPNARDNSGSFLTAYITTGFGYLPILLVGFGFIFDILAQTYNYSGASITGLGSILINRGLKMAFGNIELFQKQSIPSLDTPVLPNQTDVFKTVFELPRTRNYCNLPGFDSGGLLPDTMLVSLSTLFYYLYQLHDTGKPIDGIGLFIGSTILFESVLLEVNRCLPKSLAPNADGKFGMFNWKKWTPAVLGITSTVALSAIMGCFYYATKAILLSIKHKSNKSSGPDGNIIPVGGCNGEICPKPNEEFDLFVMEAYKDGELVTSTIAE